MNEKNQISLLSLFWQFFKIGCYTFGGGFSIVAQIQKEYADKRGWISDTDLLEITSVGRSLPGIMIANVSYLFGYHLTGFPGALVCLLGLCLPSIMILALVTWGYTAIRDNVYFIRAMTGVRASVAPIIAAAALKMRKAALTEAAGWVFLLLALALYMVFDVNCFLIVLSCGILGIVFCSWKQHRKGVTHDPS